LNKLRVIRRSDFFKFNYFSLAGGIPRSQSLVVEKVLRIHAPWCFYEKLFAGGLSREFYGLLATRLSLCLHYEKPQK
jgi:hypothetical protein